MNIFEPLIVIKYQQAEVICYLNNVKIAIVD